MRYIGFTIVGLLWAGTLCMTVQQSALKVRLKEIDMEIIMFESTQKGMVSREAKAYYSNLIRRGYERYKADNGNSYLDYDKLEDKIFKRYYDEAFERKFPSSK